MTTSPNLLRTTARALLAAAVLTVPVACGDDKEATDDTSTSVAADAKVTVSDAWVRLVPAASKNSAAYMMLKGGGSDDALTKVAVDPSIAAMVQIHETTMTGGTSGMSGETMGASGMNGGMVGGSGMSGGGMMEMHPVDAVEVPAGDTVELKPGGYHVMLMDLAKPLEKGQKITLTLTFREAGEITVDAPVSDGS